MKEYRRLLDSLVCAVIVFSVCFFALPYSPAVVTVEFETSQAGEGQLYYDLGKGLSEENSVKFVLKRENQNHKVYSVVIPRQGLASLRLDPMAHEGYFVVHSLRYQDFFNEFFWDAKMIAEKAVFPPGIAWKLTSDGLVGHARDADPWLSFSGLESVGNRPSRQVLLLTAFKASLFFWVCCLLWWKYFLKRDSIAKLSSLKVRLLQYLEGAPLGAQRFWRYIVGGGLGVVAFLVALNIVVDPFYIWQSKVLPYEYQVNERFAKVAYLETQHERFNGYIFGSSRSASTDPRMLEKYAPGISFYNMAVSGGSLYDHLAHLRYFLRSGYAVRLVYLQLDNEMLDTFRYPKENYLNRQHPHVRQESPLFYHGEYATIFPYEYLKGKLDVNWRQQSWKSFDIHNTGCILETHWEKLMASSPDEYVLDRKRFPLERIMRSRQDVRLGDNLQALQELKQLCEDNGIHLVVYMGPTNWRTWNEVDFAAYARLLRETVKIIPYWDFSGYNSVSENDFMFYEKSHYRPLVAEWIASRIFAKPCTDLPMDFGILVSAGNVEERIRYHERQFARRDRQQWWGNDGEEKP